MSYEMLPLILLISVVAGGMVILSVQLYEAIRTLSLARASNNWPRTEGRIVSASIDEYLPRASIGWRYTPQLQYEYVVGGVSYQQTRIGYWYNKRYSERTLAAEELTQWQNLGPLWVYYHPDKPEEAVLLRGTVCVRFELLSALTLSALVTLTIAGWMELANFVAPFKSVSGFLVHGLLMFSLVCILFWLLTIPIRRLSSKGSFAPYEP